MLINPKVGVCVEEWSGVDKLWIARLVFNGGLSMAVVREFGDGKKTFAYQIEDLGPA